MKLRSIGSKIIGGFMTVTLLFVIAIAGSSLVQMKVSMMTDEANHQLDQLTNMQYLTNLIRQTDDTAARYLLSGSDTEKQAYTASVDRMNGFIEIYQSEEGLSTEEQAAVKQVVQGWQTYAKELDSVIASYEQTGKAVSGTALSGVSAEELLAKLDELQGSLKTNVDSNQSDIETYRSYSMIVSLSVTGAAIVLAVFIGILMSRRIASPVRAVSRQLKQIADGDADLTQRLHVRSQDEIGEMASHFNRMLEKLGGMIARINETSNQIADSSAQLKKSSYVTREASETISSTMQEVAVGTDKQVEDLGRNVQAVSEISAGITHIAQNIEAVTSHSIHSSTLAGEGEKNIQAVVRQMTAIHEAISALSKVIGGFVDRSKDIRTIMEEMSEIAAQTNLLALNASIEASRAGDQGRGFAVVAGEVKKLAERSKLSADRVHERLIAMQSEAANAAQVMDASWNQVEQGMTLANEAGKSFVNIQQAVDEVSGQVQQVSAAIEEITASAEEISDSMRHVAEISAQTASGAEFVSESSQQQKQLVIEFEAAADEMASSAKELQRVLGQLRV